jgi:hypothetical protein
MQAFDSTIEKFHTFPRIRGGIRGQPVDAFLSRGSNPWMRISLFFAIFSLSFLLKIER